MPDARRKLIHMIIAAVREPHPHFQYTRIQVNIGLTSGLHTDDSNLGSSLICAIDPHCGGQLWIHCAVEGQVLNIRNWQAINGRMHHRNLPFIGERVSVVLFTHAGACSPQRKEAITAVAMDNFPVPNVPNKYNPEVDELKFINAGMGAAAEAF